MSKELTKTDIISLLEDFNAQNIKVIDTQDKSPWFDYIIICEANNIRLVKSIVERLLKYFKENKISHKDVIDRSDSWSIVDCNNISIHIFLDTERKAYNLEKIWDLKKDAKVVE